MRRLSYACARQTLEARLFHIIACMYRYVASCDHGPVRGICTRARYTLHGQNKLNPCKDLQSGSVLRAWVTWVRSCSGPNVLCINSHMHARQQAMDRYTTCHVQTSLQHSSKSIAHILSCLSACICYMSDRCIKQQCNRKCMPISIYIGNLPVHALKSACMPA